MKKYRTGNRCHCNDETKVDAAVHRKSRKTVQQRQEPCTFATMRNQSETASVNGMRAKLKESVFSFP